MPITDLKRRKGARWRTVNDEYGKPIVRLLVSSGWTRGVIVSNDTCYEVFPELGGSIVTTRLEKARKICVEGQCK
jgi:hypothetical protein